MIIGVCKVISDSSMISCIYDYDVVVCCVRGLLVTRLFLLLFVAVFLCHRYKQPHREQCHPSYRNPAKPFHRNTCLLLCHRHDCDDVAATSLDVFIITPNCYHKQCYRIAYNPRGDVLGCCLVVYHQNQQNASYFGF